MLDLLLKNAKTYLDGSFTLANVGVKDGKIAVVTEPSELPEAAEVLDSRISI